MVNSKAPQPVNCFDFKMVHLVATLKFAFVTDPNLIS